MPTSTVSNFITNDLCKPLRLRNKKKIKYVRSVPAKVNIKFKVWNTTICVHCVSTNAKSSFGNVAFLRLFLEALLWGFFIATMWVATARRHSIVLQVKMFQRCASIAYKNDNSTCLVYARLLLLLILILSAIKSIAERKSTYIVISLRRNRQIKIEELYRMQPY